MPPPNLKQKVVFIKLKARFRKENPGVTIVTMARTLADARNISGYCSKNTSGVDTTLIEFCWVTPNWSRGFLDVVLQTVLMSVGLETLTYV